MATNQPSSSGAPAAPAAQEYIVRIPKDRSKKSMVLKFANGRGIDFTKCGKAQMERQDNLKTFKNANDIDQQPKFGAGSEFGRSEKDIARRKKYGMKMRNYNPDDQPWMLQTGTGKQAKKFKGTREGGINENASYYIFTQCADGAFDAVPVDEWYSFNPVINYKFLDAEEAEEEFTRRDKSLNKFAIMVRKRVKNEDEIEDPDKEEEGGKKQKKPPKSERDLMITEMDNWSDSDQEIGEEDDSDGEKPKKSKKDDKKKKPKKTQRNSKKNDADEAIEESDEGDYDELEVDYITDTSSDEDAAVNEKKTMFEEQKGVEDETGLRDLNESDQSDEEAKEDDEDKDKEEKQKKVAGSDSESSASSASGSDDSDLEGNTKYSALFLQKKKRPGTPSTGSRSSTPTVLEESGKRPATPDNPAAKRVKTESPLVTASSSSTPAPSDGLTEENVRRYLTRKPMTTKELLQKFKSKKTDLTKEQIVQQVAQILKKINPEKKTINGKMYLMIKKKS